MENIARGATPRNGTTSLFGDDPAPYRLVHADCTEHLPTLPDECVDAVLTDPPYHLTQASRAGSPRTNDPETPFGRHRLADKGFMGKVWDGGDVAFRPELWREVLRVIRPGGHVLAFGGARTAHRLTCALEDAGFEIRGQVAWVYAGGMPKHRGQLRPSLELIAVARRPFRGSAAANVAAHGVGALRVDACRLAPGAGGTRDGEATATARYAGRGAVSFATTPGPRGGSAAGRWPPDVAFACCGEEPHAGGCPAGHLDEQSGASTSRGGRGSKIKHYGEFGGGERIVIPGDPGYGDDGGASRFFPVFRYCSKVRGAERAAGGGHPTQKPVALLRWLCRLVAPPGALVLDPFAGVASAGVAALAEGCRYYGIEAEAGYVAAATARLAEAAR